MISNIQIAPPREDVKHRETRSRRVDSKKEEIETERMDAIEEWQVVENKSTRRRKAKVAGKQGGQTPGKPKPDNKTGTSSKVAGKESSNAGTAQKRRRPRTAAVAIKGVTEGFSYASALRSLREKIVLPELKIENFHIRKAANGEIIIEIPGKEKSAEADKLKEKIAEGLGETAKVSRLKIRGKVRLVGLDDSVVSDEVADVIAGGCLSEEVKVGTIRPMANDLHTVWASCPIEAAIKASATNKIKIGWTVARIELLKSRPIQCYRCWNKGHLRAQCQADIDLSRTCYRCGEEGHPAAACKNAVACALCKLQGKPFGHRVGAAQCGADSLERERGVSHRRLQLPWT